MNSAEATYSESKDIGNIAFQNGRKADRAWWLDSTYGTHKLNGGRQGRRSEDEF